MIVCKLGIHRYQPTQVFWSRINHGKYDSLHSNFSGHQCQQCGKRKLKKLVGYLVHSPTPDERQDAYDWLNRVGEEPVKNRVLKLVRR